MSVFTKIVSGEFPCYKIAEDDNYFAFLDIFPLVKGHVLVVPKMEIDNLFDLPEKYLAGMLIFAKPIAKAIEKVFKCNRCGVCVVGIEVPHAHMHLLPINSANDINFTRPKLSIKKEEMEEIQQNILKYINTTG